MANHSKRARSRKRRPSSNPPRAGAAAENGPGGKAPSATAATASTATATTEPESAPRAPASSTAARVRASAERRRLERLASRPQTAVSRTYGERPKPPWHPLPLSELLILVGAIGVVVGFARGISHGTAPLLAGIAAIAIGTLEVTLREHRSGYRSHMIMLAALPIVVFHSVLLLVLSAFIRVPALANVGLLAVDLALFLVIFKLLRTSFLTARTRAAGRG